MINNPECKKEEHESVQSLERANGFEEGLTVATCAASLPRSGRWDTLMKAATLSSINNATMPAHSMTYLGAGGSGR
jgi:hypothetical protein